MSRMVRRLLFGAALAVAAVGVAFAGLAVGAGRSPRVLGAVGPRASRAARHAPYVCRGSAKRPGVLAGRFESGVVVIGTCFVNEGPARVRGKVTVEKGSVLAAAFGRYRSSLTVSSEVNVDRGATFVLGCNPRSFTCLDDRAFRDHSIRPTLSSHGWVGESVVGKSALAVIVHSSTIRGAVIDMGGGGGSSCTVPKRGLFADWRSPVYSAFEDSRITAGISVWSVRSCWLGIARDRAYNIDLRQNTMGDPDAIEVLGNFVGGINCQRNRSHLWDSSEKRPGRLFPRTLQRNHAGQRLGQCKNAGPLTRGGPPAGGPF